MIEPIRQGPSLANGEEKTGVLTLFIRCIQACDSLTYSDT